MDHTSLYRKYRPQTFDDVLGQEHVTRTLQNALKTDPPSIVHAYLFCGPRGTGKTTTARILAKALNCERGPSPSPCGQCESCTDIARGSAMDVLELDAASNTGVDNVREVIISKVNFKPALGRYRMYIIDEAHQLSNHAFNALLKTIEEPPPHAVFVLATTEFQKVPATIQSRCQRHIFHHVSDADISKRIRYVAESEGVRVDDGAVRSLAKAADGALRDSLSLLEQMIAYAGEHVTEEAVHATLGTIAADELDAIVAAMECGDAGGALKLSRAIVFRGISAANLAHALAAHVRDRLVEDINNNRPAQQAHSMQFMELFSKSESDMRWNASHDLVLELALLKSCALSSATMSAPVAATPPQEGRELVSQVGGRIKPKPGPPPASTAPAPKAPAVIVGEASSVGSGGLEGAWQQVLDRLRQQRQAPLVAFLLEGMPTALEGDRLVVTFTKAFHHKQASDPKRRQVVEAVLREFTQVFPPNVQLECCLVDGEGAAVGDDLVSEAVSLFGAKVVK